MIAWLRRLWNRLVHAERQAEEDEHEANRQAVIREAFRTGKPVYGTYNEDGNFVMKVMPDTPVGEDGEE